MDRLGETPPGRIEPPRSSIADNSIDRIYWICPAVPKYAVSSQAEKLRGDGPVQRLCSGVRKVRSAVDQLDF